MRIYYNKYNIHKFINILGSSICLIRSQFTTQASITITTILQ